MEKNTYTILEEKRADVEKKIKRCEKKAQKYGAFFSASFGEPYCMDVQREEDGRKYTEKYEVCDLTIESDVIRNGEYTVIARIEHAENGNIVNAFGCDVRPEWVTMPAHCDHCNGNHNQKITMIVSDGKTEKQVGRTCLKDYCGIDPQIIGMVNQFVGEIEELAPDCYDFSERIPIVYDAVSVLGFAIEIVEEQGYRKSDERGSNKEKLFDAMRDHYMPSEKAHKKAQEMAEEIEKMSVETAVDALLNNVQSRIKGMYCKVEDFGYFAYAPVAFERYKERLARQAKREADTKELREASSFIGVVGARLVIEIAEVKLLTSFFSAYGETFLYRFIDKSGNVLVWFASSAFDTDGVSKIKATIKDHSERDGVKQTVITRVKAA